MRQPKVPSPELVAAIVSGTTVLIIYLTTLAPDITWANFGGDGPELITASMTLGVPHAPGYPTYVLFGRLFGLIPYGVPALRYNLFSAISMATATAFVTLTATGLTRYPPRSGKYQWPVAAAVAGLVFGLTPLVWGQALIAEVYALNLMILSAVLWLLFTTEHHHPFAVGLLLGLAATTHLTSILMTPLVIYWLPRTTWKRLVVGIGVGLSPFLLLPLMAHSGGPAVWGQADNLRGWLSIVTAEIYRPNFFSVEPSIWFDRLRQWPATYLGLLAVITFPLLLIGFFLPDADRRTRTVMRGFLIISAIYFICAVSYDAHDAPVFLLPGVMLLVISLGPGLSRIGKACIVIPILMIVLNYNNVDLNREPGIRSSTMALFQNVPPDALLFTPGDESIATLWYFTDVEGHRPDLIAVDNTLFQFDWYRTRLGAKYPDLVYLDDDQPEKFIQANAVIRPVCFVSLVSTADNYCIDNDKLVQGQTIDEKNSH